MIITAIKLYPFHTSTAQQNMHAKQKCSITAYFRIVLDDVQSSNRMLYPTSCPSPTSISSATRAATDMAATRRG